MKYCVPVGYRGMCNFVVEAPNPEAAAEAAKAKFKNGDEPDTTGGEWEAISYAGEPEAMP